MTLLRLTLVSMIHHTTWEDKRHHLRGNNACCWKNEEPSVELFFEEIARFVS